MKEFNMKSLIYKFKNIEFIIYFDIGITFLALISLIYSLIPNSFNIIPLQLIKPFIGINHLTDIIESLHYILIGVSITFIVQSITMLFEYRIRGIESSSIMKLLFYKWKILTIISAIPYAFNVQIPPILLFKAHSYYAYFGIKHLKSVEYLIMVLPILISMIRRLPIILLFVVDLPVN